MKKTTKAVLASAFIFPGIGQFYLKSRILGMAFVTLGVGATCVIFYYVINIAMTISERIISGEIEPDILLMRKLILEEPSLNIPLVNISTWVLIGVWLSSIIHAYLIGKSTEES